MMMPSAVHNRLDAPRGANDGTEGMSVVSEQTRPFGFRDKLGYLFGDFGNDFTFILSSSFLLKFYTDVMGVPAAVVGVVMMIARFVDAFTDVTMGRICDRSRITAAGKFKPWILRMSGPVAIASFLIYQSGLAGMPMAAKIAYLVVTYILWGSIFYTAINIPYGSMASDISPEPGDRQSLSTYRSMGGMMAGTIIGALVPMVAYRDVNGQAVLDGGTFTLIAGLFSVLAVGCYLLCYTLVTERVRPQDTPKSKQPSTWAMLKNAASNRSLISIIVASILMLLAQLTIQSMANYVYPNYYNSPKAQAASTFLMLGGMSVAAAIAKPLARRFGKTEISAATNALAALISLGLYFFRPANVWVYVAIQTLNWLGLGVFAMVSWALITDVIDDAEVKNGIREDGTVYALYSFARKLGQAASAGLTGGLLTIIGYDQTTAFEPSVINGIYSISALVPALGFGLLAAVLWWWYPLRKAVVERNVATLKRKRERGNQE